jgi:hypothetical protein
VPRFIVRLDLGDLKPSGATTGSMLDLIAQPVNSIRIAPTEKGKPRCKRHERLYKEIGVYEGLHSPEFARILHCSAKVLESVRCRSRVTKEHVPSHSGESIRKPSQVDVGEINPLLELLVKVYGLSHLTA